MGSQKNACEVTTRTKRTGGDSCVDQPLNSILWSKQLEFSLELDFVVLLLAYPFHYSRKAYKVAFAFGFNCGVFCVESGVLRIPNSIPLTKRMPASPASPHLQDFQTSYDECKLHVQSKNNLIGVV